MEETALAGLLEHLSPLTVSKLEGVATQTNLTKMAYAAGHANYCVSLVTTTGQKSLRKNEMIETQKCKASAYKS